MPKEMNLSYRFGGPKIQLIYSEAEMAQSLDLTIDQMYKHLDPHNYGKPDDDRIQYSFHAHPFSSGKFLFTRDSYLSNIQIMNRRKWLISKNQWDEISKLFIFTFKDVDTPEKRRVRNHTIIDTEEEFWKKLEEFKQAIKTRNTNYHYSVKLYWKTKDEEQSRC